LPFQGDKLIEKIGYKTIIKTKHVYTEPDGTLAGTAVGYGQEGRGYFKFFLKGDRFKIVNIP